MTKFTYNATVFNYYSKRRRNYLLLMLIEIFGAMIFNKIIGAEIPDLNRLIDGSMYETEQLGLVFGFLQIVCIGLTFRDVMSSAFALEGVEMSCIEVFKSHILVTCNTQTSSLKLPTKSFFRLEYTDIQKIEYEEGIQKWRKSNFTIFHKTGFLQLCLDDPAEAAGILDRKIRAAKSGDSESKRKKILTEKTIENETPTIGVCPKCQTEFELPSDAEYVVCPTCFAKLEF